MVHVDLDAARAARAEARGELPTVTLGGKEYRLVGELPLAFAEALANDRYHEAFALLLADPEQLDEFAGNVITGDDLKVIAQDVYAAGGVGESSASQRSSTNGGKRSRPTSPAPTA